VSIFTSTGKDTETSGRSRHLLRFTPTQKTCFVIPKSRKQSERIVQAINRPTRDTAESFIYKWSDTREVRAPDSKAYAVLNDMEPPIPAGVMDAFRNYSIDPVPWSRKAEAIAELAA